MNKCLLSVLALSLFVCTFTMQGSDEKINMPDDILHSMTLREKVCKMMIVRPDALADTLTYDCKCCEPPVTCADSLLSANFRRFPVGGICLFSQNILDTGQLKSFTAGLHSLRPSPLICVDEEGGRVSRVANSPGFALKRMENLTDFAVSNAPDSIYALSNYIGSYLKEYGFDVDFAPVADIYANSGNMVMKGRTLGTEPDSVACRVVSYIAGLRDAGVLSCLKHYPGHGGVEGDTHRGKVILNKSWDDILEYELVPFKAGIAAGVPFVMVAHISLSKLSDNDDPATLSRVLIEEKLRGELGYDGVIVTDGLEMDAVSQRYTAEEVAVKAVLAGSDMLLLPVDLPSTVNALIKAVETGIIPESRIDESVRRILALTLD